MSMVDLLSGLIVCGFFFRASNTKSEALKENPAGHRSRCPADVLRLVADHVGASALTQAVHEATVGAGGFLAVVGRGLDRHLERTFRNLGVSRAEVEPFDIRLQHVGVGGATEETV